MNRKKLYGLSVLALAVAGLVGYLVGPAARDKIETIRLEQELAAVQACVNGGNHQIIILADHIYTSGIVQPGEHAASFNVAVTAADENEFEALFGKMLKCAADKSNFGLYTFQFVKIYFMELEFVDRPEKGILLQASLAAVVTRATLEQLAASDHPFFLMMTMASDEAGAWALDMTPYQKYLTYANGGAEEKATMLFAKRYAELAEKNAK